MLLVFLTLSVASANLQMSYLSEIKEWYCDRAPRYFHVIDCEAALKSRTVREIPVKKELKHAKSAFCHSNVSKSDNADIRCVKYNDSHPQLSSATGVHPNNVSSEVQSNSSQTSFNGIFNRSNFTLSNNHTTVEITNNNDMR